MLSASIFKTCVVQGVCSHTFQSTVRSVHCWQWFSICWLEASGDVWLPWPQGEVVVSLGALGFRRGWHAEASARLPSCRSPPSFLVGNTRSSSTRSRPCDSAQKELCYNRHYFVNCNVSCNYSIRSSFFIGVEDIKRYYFFITVNGGLMLLLQIMVTRMRISLEYINGLFCMATEQHIRVILDLVFVLH